jgi:hypothetical protein
MAKGTQAQAKWNYEKAHSILHKVSQIVLWGNLGQALEVSTNMYVYCCTWYIHIG